MLEITAIVTRRVQKKHPIGEYAVSLPIGWVRYIELKYRDHLDVVEMYVKGEELVIQLAPFRALGYRDEGRGGKLMKRAEYLRLNGDHKRLVMDDKGEFVSGDLKKIYRSGKTSRVVSLSEDWVRTQQQRVHKEFRSVAITITNRLWINPYFPNIPHWPLENTRSTWDASAQSTDRSDKASSEAQRHPMPVWYGQLSLAPSLGDDQKTCPSLTNESYNSKGG